MAARFVPGFQPPDDAAVDAALGTFPFECSVELEESRAATIARIASAASKFNATEPPVAQRPDDLDHVEVPCAVAVVSWVYLLPYFAMYFC
jgi:hypothetical protein